jgi:hypothetical protein
MRSSLRNGLIAATTLTVLGVLAVFLSNKKPAATSCLSVGWDSRTATMTQDLKPCPLTQEPGVSKGYQTDIREGRLEVRQNDKTIWTSPLAWQVQEAHMADLNGDGEEEIAALTMAPGEFGRIKPFWVTQDDKGVRQHIYIFNLKDNVFHPVWMASRVYRPTCAFRLGRILQNGRDQLVTLDAEKTASSSTCQASYVSIWDWNGWGFSLVWQSATGTYDGLGLDGVNGQIRAYTALK